MIYTAATPFWDENTILLLSLSKLGLPGVRTGIVVAAPEVIELIRNNNAINNLAPSRVGPELITPLLHSRQLTALCDDIIRPFYEKRLCHALDVVSRTMGHLPVRVHKPEGALFMWLWFEDLPVTSEVLYQQLMAQGVYVLAGHHFYPQPDEDWRHQQECIRVNYAGEEAVVEQGLSLIAEQVTKIYQLDSP